MNNRIYKRFEKGCVGLVMLCCACAMSPLWASMERPYRRERSGVSHDRSKGRARSRSREKARKGSEKAAPPASFMQTYKEEVMIGVVGFGMVAVVGLLYKNGSGLPKRDEEKGKNVPTKGEEKYVINLDPSKLSCEVSDDVWKKAVAKSWTNPKLPPKKATRNDACVGYAAMAEKLFEQLEAFEAWHKADDWEMFDKKHFDWWIFPVPYISRGYGTQYAVFKEDIEGLKDYVYDGPKAKYKGRSYAQAQKRATYLVLWAAGWWDLDAQKVTGKCRRIPSQDRLGKMLHATLLFDRETYGVVNAFLRAIQKHRPGNYPNFVSYYIT